MLFSVGWWKVCGPSLVIAKLKLTKILQFSLIFTSYITFDYFAAVLHLRMCTGIYLWHTEEGGIYLMFKSPWVPNLEKMIFFHHFLYFKKYENNVYLYSWKSPRTQEFKINMSIILLWWTIWQNEMKTFLKWIHL